MTIDEVLIVALAAYGLTRALTVDSISRPAREAIERWAWTVETDFEGAPVLDDDGQPAIVGRGRSRFSRWFHDRAGELLTCPYCLGFWVGLAGIAAYEAGGWWRWAVVAFAVRGVQVVVHAFGAAQQTIAD